MDRFYNAQMTGLELTIFTAIIAFLIVIGTMPSTIRKMSEKGITGTDVHKPNMPEVPKGGGVVLLFAIVTSLLLVIGLSTFTISNGEVDSALLAALVSILMAGMIGLLDDNLDFRNRTKIILPLIASIPLAALQVGVSKMNIPFIGAINLGILYPLVIIPLMLTFIVDSTNMYGGMNGLEAGLGAINSSAIIMYVFLFSSIAGGVLSGLHVEAAIVAASLLGATSAFFLFNKYPAKILPGDVGRLPIGAAMASALILGNMDRLAVLLYIPFGINFLLYIVYQIYVKKTGIQYQKFAKARNDGTLKVVGPFTMYWLFPYFFRVTEKRNVILLLLLQAVIAYSSVLLLLIAYPFGVGWI